MVASSNTANLSGIEEVVLAGAAASFSVVAGELDDLTHITSNAGGTVHLANFMSWTNTGTNVDNHILWAFGTAQLWISDTCTVTS